MRAALLREVDGPFEVVDVPEPADDGRVAKWWIPESIEFIDEVPKTSVGKFSKKTLRERFAGARTGAGS